MNLDTPRISSALVAPALTAPVKIWAAKQQEVKFEDKNSLAWSECHRSFLIKYSLKLKSVIALLEYVMLGYTYPIYVVLVHWHFISIT